MELNENQNIGEKKISNEDKYRQLSDIEHVLMRSGNYLGNMHSEVIPYNLFKPSENKIVRLEGVAKCDGLLKLFDEIISNSIDERISKTRLFNINQIDVEVLSNGQITVRDDGGIPIEKHKETNKWIPTMIFGTLKTSSNYTEKREGAGLNGLGSKLTNIFSTQFQVISCDGKNQLDVCWINNMREIKHEIVSKSKQHFTQTKFNIELSRFDIDSLDMSTVRIIQKRCIDAAAANPGLKINFKSDLGKGALDSTWVFNSFKEFVRLHTDSETILYDFTSQNFKDNVVLVPAIDKVLDYNFGFVNGSVCSEGTHIRKIELQVVKKILEILKTKDIELITEKDILSKTSIFVSTFVMNPDYASQDKKKLTNKIPSTSLSLSTQFLDSLKDSEIVKQLVDYYNIKYLAEQKKNLRAINKTLKTTKSKKLVSCSSNDSSKNELWLFEGTSAANGFEYARNPNYQACYLLRGKVKNTFSLTRNQIVENLELREIIAALGLQFGDPKGNLKNCKFKRIIIATDADTDGSHITGLLLTFLAINFPELFVDGRIFRALSPIVIASKGSGRNIQEKFYYTQDDFKLNEPLLKGWDISYKKGLGALIDRHYLEMVGNCRLEQFVLEGNYKEDIGVWFSKSTAQRKEILGEESNITFAEIG